MVFQENISNNLMPKINYTYPKRIILLGSGDLMIKIYNWLSNKNINAMIITSPRQLNDKSGFDINFKNQLIKDNVKYEVFEDISSIESSKKIKDFKPDLSISFGAAWIFNKKNIKNLFKNKLLNFHSTRLPTNRGCLNYSWQILTANKIGTLIIHEVDDRLDTGDILFFDEFLYSNKAKIPIDYHKEFNKYAFNFFVDFFINLKKKKLIKKFSQLDYLSSYNPRINTEVNGWIDWNMDASQLDKFISAFDDPYKGAHTFLNDKKVYIKKSSVNFQDQIFHSFNRGIVYRNNLKWICIASKNGNLIIEEVLDINGKNILKDIKEGDRFQTPTNLSDKSLYRVKYNSKGLIEQND